MHVLCHRSHVRFSKVVPELPVSASPKLTWIWQVGNRREELGEATLVCKYIVVK